MKTLDLPESTGALTGSWAGKYRAESAGEADVVLAFYQLDRATLEAAAKGSHEALAVGSEAVVGIFQTTTGAIGYIHGTLTGDRLVAIAEQTTPGCEATYQMQGSVSGDEFDWTFSGTDCLGPEDGKGRANRII